MAKSSVLALDLILDSFRQEVQGGKTIVIVFLLQGSSKCTLYVKELNSHFEISVNT